MDAYALYDVRTGKRFSVNTYPTPMLAAAAIDRYRERDALGERPDIHDFMPHLGFIQLTPETLTSVPGDIIDGRN